MPNEKIHIQTLTKQIAYGDLWGTSRYLLDQGKRDTNKYYYPFLASITFAAFTLEAFLNHIGEHIFDHWKNHERLPPQEKANIICKRLKIRPDYSRMPWQVIPQILAIRDRVAHGKTTLETKSKILPSAAFDKIFDKTITSDLQKYATLQNAEKVQTRTKQVLETIFNAAKIPGEILFMTASMDIVGHHHIESNVIR